MPRHDHLRMLQLFFGNYNFVGMEKSPKMIVAMAFRLSGSLQNTE